MMENMEKVKDEAYKAAKEILEKAKLEKGDLFVVGCSTSEVCGETIGTHSKPELADMVFGGIYEATQEYSVYLAAQCCEHLNRALILEKDAARKYGYPMVNVVPQPKAGGSFATAAYKNFKHPVAVEHIKAAAGMDIEKASFMIFFCFSLSPSSLLNLIFSFFCSTAFTKCVSSCPSSTITS